MIHYVYGSNCRNHYFYLVGIITGFSKHPGIFDLLLPSPCNIFIVFCFCHLTLLQMQYQLYADSLVFYFIFEKNTE